MRTFNATFALPWLAAAIFSLTGGACKDPKKEEASSSSAKFNLDVERYTVPLESDDLALGGTHPKVTIVLFSNYACNPCRRTWEVMRNLVEDYGDQIRVVHRSVAISGYQANDDAVEAALAAADQGKFWEMHWRLFEHPEDLSRPMLRAHAKAIGLNEEKFNDDLQTGKFTSRRLRDQRRQEMLGVMAGPATFVNGVFVLGFRPEADWHVLIDLEIQRVNEMLQEGVEPDKVYAKLQEGTLRGPVKLDPGTKAKLPEEKPKPDSAPLTIQAPDPDQRYIVTSGEEMGTGPVTAPVQIVEFTDFQCPFCRKANAEAFHELRETYGDKLRWVVRHFPLPIHPSAHGAARAAWAAGQQNAFWAFHQALFEAKGSLGRRMFEEIAESLKLDVEKFRRDFESPKSKEAIDRDQEFARKLGVSGTPALFINGRFLSGALSTPTYTRLVEEELAAAEKAKSEGISIDKFVEFRLKDAIPESGFPNSGKAPKP